MAVTSATIITTNGVGTNFVVGLGETRPEGPRAEGVCFWGGAASPSHQLGGLQERSKLLQRGPPKGFLVFCAVRLPFAASQYVLHTLCMASY